MRKSIFIKPLVSLILMATLAIGVASAGAGKGVVFAAADLSASSLVRAGEGVTVSAGAQFTKDGGYSESPRGLLLTVPKETASYSFDISGVFKNNMALKFNIPGQSDVDGAYRYYDSDLVFEIYDVASPNVGFEVTFGPGRGTDWNGWNGMAWVTYDYNGTEVYRAGSSRDGGELHDKYVHKYAGWGAGTSAPDNGVCFMPYPEQNGVDGGNAADNFGYLILQYNAEGNLEIWARGQEGGNKTIVRLAVFEKDPATYVPDQSDGWFADCDLPAMPFAEGFGIRARTEGSHDAGDQAVMLLEIYETADRATSFIEDYTNNTSVFQRFTESGTKYDLSAETIATPAFYTEFRNRVTISADDAFPYAFVAGATTQIPGATYITADNTTPAPVAKIELTDPDGEKTDITASKSVTPDVMGEYTVTYTAIENSERPGNTIFFKFTVDSFKTDTANLLVLDGNAQYDLQNSGDYVGINLTPKTNDAFSGTFDGIFTDDFSIKFTVPSTLPFDGSSNGLSVVFTVSDLEGNKVFSVHFVSDGWGTNAWVRYGDEIRAGVTNAVGEDLPGQWRPRIYYVQPKPYDDHGIFRPNMNSSQNTQPGELSFEWAGDILNIWALNGTGALKVKLGSFDGTDTTFAIPEGGDVAFASDAELNEKGKFALPKIYEQLKDGYTVSFTAGVEGVKGNALHIAELNGTKIERDYLGAEGKSEIFLENEADATVYLPQNTQAGDVTFRYTIAFMPGLEKITEVKIPLAADTSSIGQKEVTVTDDSVAEYFGQLSKTYTVIVEEAYRLSFETNGGKAIGAIDWSEHTRNRLGDALPTAERAYWTFGGWYADEDCTEPVTLGEIQGTATVYAKWLDEEPPVIELNGLNDVMTVQVGNVAVGQSDVRVSDAAEGNEIALIVEVKYENGSFALLEGFDFSRLGTYTVRYTAADPSGNESFIERTIVVVDEIPPVITLEGEVPLNGFTGIRIELPAATATKDATVEITITFGGAPIALTERGFVPDAPGTYEAVYSASDAHGNTAYINKQITVVNDTEEPIISGGLEATTVKKDSRVEIVAATATDNCDAAVEVSVKVYYGTEEVSLTDNGFTAANLGVYRVEYSAKDSSGNIAVKNVEITVMENVANGSNAGSCNSSFAGTMSFAAVALLAAACMMIVKNRKTRQR